MTGRYGHASIEPPTTALSDFRTQVFEALCRRYQEAQSSADVRVQPTTFEYAQQFLAMLPSWLPVAPEVFVEQDGEIGFDWDLAARSVVSVSVGRDGTLNYAALIGHKRNHGSEVMGDSIPDEVLLYFDRLFSAKR
jgi:hypothetical protein